MATARELLQMQRQRSLQNLANRQSDIGEQLKTGYMLNDMEGGFGNNEQRKLRSEATALRGDIEEGYKLQDEYLKTVEENQKEQARKNKLGNYLKTGGTLLGAGVGAVLGGPAGAQIGASLGSNIGQVGNTLYGTGEAPMLDFSFIGDWQNYKNRNKYFTE